LTDGCVDLIEDSHLRIRHSSDDDVTLRKLIRLRGQRRKFRKNRSVFLLAGGIGRHPLRELSLFSLSLLDYFSTAKLDRSAIVQLAGVVEVRDVRLKLDPLLLI
jgi:hypothetical protein